MMESWHKLTEDDMSQKHIKRIAGVIALSWIVVAGGATAQDITGGYAMSGYTESGSPYTGTTTIARTGNTYSVEQNTGGGILEGTGIFQGNSLAAVFSSGGDPMLAIYDIQPDGSLIGQWTSFGGFEVGTETLTPLGGGSGK